MEGNDGNPPFELLRFIKEDLSFINKIQPSDIDKLSSEGSRVLRECSAFRQEDCHSSFDWMLLLVGSIDDLLSARTDPHSGAMLVLYRRSLLNSENLEALCKMCDPLTSTGEQITIAVWLLHKLCQVNSAWRISFKDGNSFSLYLIECFEKLVQSASSSGIFAKAGDVWNAMFHKLFLQAVETCKDPSYKILQLLINIDWPAFFDCGRNSFGMGRAQAILQNATFYIILQRRAEAAMHETNMNWEGCKAFIKKLGRCDQLCKQLLCIVINGGISVEDKLRMLAMFLQSFFNCLVWRRRIVGISMRSSRQVDPLLFQRQFQARRSQKRR